MHTLKIKKKERRILSDIYGFAVRYNEIKECMKLNDKKKKKVKENKKT
jgi:hypothetical protein